MNRSTYVSRLFSWVSAIALGLCPNPCWAHAEPVAPLDIDVTKFDIDELMQVHVSIAGKKPEPFARIPAAVYVIRGNDLERSAVHTLADAMRMVPGFHVARQRANTWSVSARGSNGGNANKLLVLRDGRTVYSNLQSGVFWDVQDTLLDNVDRIEVVRGPGGTLWGTNAVNGVINIISKRASDSQGLTVKTAAGRELRGLAGARYGFALDEQHHVRLSGQMTAIDESARGSSTHDQSNDGLLMRRTDFRSDWSRGSDALRVQGELYDGSAELTQTSVSLTAPFRTVNNDHSDLRGGHLIGEWRRSLAAESSFDVRAYYDYTSRANQTFEDRLHTGDLEAQYRFAPRTGHDAVVGMGYRRLTSDFEGGFSVQLPTERRTDDIWSAFVQDQIALRDTLWLTLGIRVEHNDYSGFELLPSARLAWAVDESSTAWLAASRAVRSPSLLDVDFRLNQQVTPGATPGLLAIFGTEHFRAEQLFALESGYRTQALSRLAVDFAVFANFYDDLRALTQGATVLETDPLPVHTLTPFFIVNENRARSYGAELAVDLELRSWWSLRTSYTHLSVNNHKTKRIADRTGPSDDQDEGLAPRNQLWLRSSMDFPYNLSLDLTGRYVGRLHANRTRRYTEADVRIAWLSRSGVEVAVVGRNLLHSERVEFGATNGAIERDLFLQLTWRPR